MFEYFLYSPVSIAQNKLLYLEKQIRFYVVYIYTDQQRHILYGRLFRSKLHLKSNLMSPKQLIRNIKPEFFFQDHASKDYYLNTPSLIFLILYSI